VPGAHIWILGVVFEVHDPSAKGGRPGSNWPRKSGYPLFGSSLRLRWAFAHTASQKSSLTRPSHPTSMRLFLGLPIPELGQALTPLTRAIELPKGRWTGPENLHLTP